MKKDRSRKNALTTVSYFMSYVISESLSDIFLKCIQ